MVSGMWNACEVETGCMLHQCAEKDLQMFIKAGNTTTCFSEFCSRLDAAMCLPDSQGADMDTGLVCLHVHVSGRL